MTWPLALVAGFALASIGAIAVWYAGCLLIRLGFDPDAAAKALLAFIVVALFFAWLLHDSKPESTSQVLPALRLGSLHPGTTGGTSSVTTYGSGPARSVELARPFFPPADEATR